eukprot:m.41377 g.41377  ORF g.41377 m.41377 type:complete len:279 (-) comp9759_c0_seq1:51-887(-)
MAFLACTIIHRVKRSLYINPSCRTKTIYFVRHGQATHNVRAEPLRESGCSHEDFMKQMQEDDEVDARLTEQGKAQAIEAAKSVSAQQAHRTVDLVVSSPLTRALHTADLVFPKQLLKEHRKKDIPRVALEDFREINGLLLNGKRSGKPHLKQAFPHWDFSLVEHDDDKTWTAEQLEEMKSVAERAHNCLHWLLSRPEQHIAVVTHGGFLHAMLNEHDDIVIKDAEPESHKLDVSNERTSNPNLKNNARRRFRNCEVREMNVSLNDCGHAVTLHPATLT